MNIQGLVPKTRQSKLPYIRDLLISNNELFIGLSETWLKEQTEAELWVEGYKLYRSDRKRAR